MQPRLLAGAALAAALWATPVLAQWTPPIGIPMPTFGINEAAPPRPNPWNSAVTGYYYVDRTHASATDNSNPFGWPAKPRQTIPLTLPAGSTVEVHNTYTKAHTSPDTIIANGTVGAPVFIRGQTAALKPRITLAMEVRGSYVILENLEFAFTDEEGISMLAPMNHGAVRNSDIHGNLTGGGISVQSFTTAIANDVVLLGNTIHDNGNVSATFDQDVHGISVSARVNNLWIVDNEIYRNSGDGLQINAGSAANMPTTHHIYVGRNTSHNNKQAGFGCKQAQDVVFSQNVAYSHRPSDSSPGAGFGFQYAPERVWSIYNRVFDSDYGWYIGNDNGLGNGQNMYYVGNVVYGIHTSGTFETGSAYGNSAFMMAGGTNRYLVNNTIHDVDGGIFCPSDQGRVVMANNIISSVTQAGGSHVFVEMPGTASQSQLRNTLFQGTVRIKWGGNSPVYTQTNVPGGCSGCKAGDPQFVSPASGNFGIPGTSPAADAGIVDAVYATFQTLYGLNIAVDVVGTPRPFGPAWDMGAYEFFLVGLSAGDASATEGDGGTSNLSVPVTLSQATTQNVTVAYATAPGTAAAGSDYTAVSGTLTFPPGTVARSVPVPIVGDAVDEDNETFTVQLSSPVGTVVLDGSATATIVDNDPAPTIALGECVVSEGNAGTTPCPFGVTLSNPSSKTVTVAYATAGLTATSGTDFQAASGTLTFPPLAVASTVNVNVVGDAVVEEDESFQMTLSNPVQGTLGTAQTEGLILDDDAVPLSNDELLPGWWQRGDLAAQPVYYRIAQAARSSYEVVVDELSGDAAPGLLLERLASDNATVLQAGTVTGTGTSVSLRWQNTTAGTLTLQHLRLRTGAAGCGTSCGTDDGYRIRVYDTTYRAPRFNASAGQVTVLMVQNRTTASVSGTAYFWSATGALLHSQAFTVPGRGLYTLNANSVAALLNRSGTITIAHNGGYGALAGKSVAAEAATGASFDTPLEPKP